MRTSPKADVEIFVLVWPQWALNGQSRLTSDRPLSGGGDIRKILDEVEKQQLICKGKSKFFTRNRGL
jgi:hypothetical protein